MAARWRSTRPFPLCREWRPLDWHRGVALARFRGRLGPALALWQNDRSRAHAVQRRIADVGWRDALLTQRSGGIQQAAADEDHHRVSRTQVLLPATVNRTHRFGHRAVLDVADERHA